MYGLNSGMLLFFDPVYNTILRPCISITISHTIASVSTTMWPFKKQKDDGDRLAEIKAAKCHKKLAVSTV